ncbi:hypothetical protein CEUSTIGMA_g6764.t1 [Chlamydomonas eustigma]|uniref:Uncharacterized protein n=1 Tax=Chlamydomonas eustigma TaxID=1157962 RepID=A0A250X8C4_9CHLO|nr:hypothetical protein CEUSTIGMA_g6764.t1 [Chlamydomonas eustigma]|eukprot:GAX79323.1 hypothetical protein CEUSTIGMA_g6764.t1 [Chlamydomonas eustigma]
MRLMSAVLRSKRAATVTAADGVPPDTICSSRCFNIIAQSFGDSAKLTLHVHRDNPRISERWFKEWALRLRPAKDMHALHIEFKRGWTRRIDKADTNKLRSPSLMDMLQWVLHGVEDAVQVITITQTHPPMFHFNTQSSHSRMGAEAGLFFSQLTHLRSLRLHGALVEIHTMACPHLRQCLMISLPQLHDLVLSNNGLDAKDLETLEPAWRHLPALQSLDLGGNELFCNAACSLAIALRSLTTLTFLSLSKNYLFYDYEDELSDFQMLSSAFSGLRQLRTLDMSFLKIFAPFGCAAFLTALNNLTALSHLNLNYVHLDFNSVHSFPGFLSGPSGLQHLSMAYFSSDKINAEGFASVLRNLTGLRYLDLSNSIRLCVLFESPQLFSSLQALTRLEVLNLSAFKMQWHPLLEWNSATEFSNALTCLKQTLQHLNLSACLPSLPLESIAIVATALSGLERLQSIDLSHNSISASSMGVLGPSLGCLTTLKSVNLSSNDRDLLSEDGASHISAALIKLTGLTFLGMSEVCGLSLVGVQQLRVLTPSLAALTKLESLDLMCSVFLTEETASSVLAPALRQLSALTQLIVGDCKSINTMGSAVDLPNNES